MARPVDEKIVRMTLDNAKFKRNVTETLGSFKAINDGISSTNGADLSRIANAVEGIQSRFSTLGVVAATVISNITSKAMEMSKKLYGALVDPIVEGGRRRAMNIEQAQFQFEGLGMDVEDTMASANEAVLGTAFGLDEAAVVAAQFGATGMRAGEEMTSALRGISGVAAMTGSSYSDIGQVFTVVAGNGRLMSNELLRLSSRGINAAATLADAFDMTESEVREMVTAGEVSFDMFATAMADAFGEHATRANETYTGSLSNLRAALARIGADVYTPRLEAMRDLFNTMTPVVNELKDALGPLIEYFNEISVVAIEGLMSAIGKIDFKTFSDIGGMSRILDSFRNISLAVTRVLYALREGFNRAFPTSAMVVILRMTEAVKNITSSMILSGDSVEKLSTIFHGLFSLFDSAWIIVSSLTKAIFGIIPEGTGGGILSFIEIIALLAIRFNESLTEGNMLTTAIDKIGDAFSRVSTYIKDPMALLEDISHLIRVDLVGSFNYMREKMEPVFSWLGETLGEVGGWFKDAFSDWGADEIMGGGFLAFLIFFLQKISGFLSGLSSGITGPIGGFFGQLKTTFSDLSRSFTGIFEELGGALRSFQEQVKYKNLLTIAIAIGILAVSLKLLEGMSITNIAKGLSALVGTMTLLSLGMMAISKIKMSGALRSSTTLVALALAVSIMASALKRVGDLDLAEIGKGLLGLAGIVATLVGAMVILGQFGGKIKTGSVQLIALATSVLILTSAVDKLSNLDGSSMAQGLLGLVGILGTLAAFLVAVKGTKLGPGTALGLIGTAAAIQVIVSAVDRISDISAGDLVKGLTTITLILAQIAIFTKVAGGGKALTSGVAISLIASALTLLLIPITKMGSMSWEDLVRGLTGMAVALTAVTLAASLASSSILGAAGIMVMAVALTALMIPIGMFSAMSWGTMLKGLTGLAAAMLVAAGAAVLLSPAAGPMLAFGAALLVIGAAVAAVGAGIALFGVGLTALSALTATSVAAIVSSLRILLRGMTGLLLDTREFLVKLGITFLDAVQQLVPKLKETLGILITSMLDFIVEKVPEFLRAGIDMYTGLLEGLEEKGPELIQQAADTILALLEGMADTLANNSGPIIDAMIRLMGEVLLVVIDAGTSMIEALFGWIPGVKKATSKVGETAEEYIRDNFGAAEVGEEKGADFADGLGGTSGLAGDAAGKVVGASTKTIEAADFFGPSEEKGKEAARGLGSSSVLEESESSAEGLMGGFSLGVESFDTEPLGESRGMGVSRGAGSDKVVSAAEDTGAALTESVGRGGRSVDLESVGENSATEIATGAGTTRSMNLLNTSGVDLAKSGRGGFKSVKTASAGRSFSDGLSSGIDSGETSLVRSATNLGRSALNAVGNFLAIRSPSRKTTEQGIEFGRGLLNGISKMTKSVGDKAKDMAVTASKALRNSLDDTIPEEEEMTIKLILDDDDFNPEDFDPDPVRPQGGFVRAMANSTDQENRQNKNKEPRDDSPVTEEVHHHNYEIGVTAGGNMSREEARKLAKTIQTELKNENDKFKMARGQEVAF